MHNPRHIVLVAILSCILVGGCSTEKLSEVDLPIPASGDGENTSIEATNTLKVSDTAASVSPASTQLQLPETDAAPEVVVQQFVKLLNLGDADNFELLLTPAALSVAGKLQFSLPPLGEPNAQIDVQPPVFSTIRGKLCFVDCEIKDSEATEISFMLRKSKQGWRVGGMMVEGESPDVNNLLSFESVTDVTQIRDSLYASTDL